ncbi:MAG: hypothetical protein KKB03_03785 [Nanoarchaeota archaeon]|nr:hypothetical protein [Nanoarchaeota archaeon]MBU1135288.1 hypothetical protein [Nanoarchaeota archaeon]MBU2520335.1 hypothetical protein [Nanoarchaeota archaeon]
MTNEIVEYVGEIGDQIKKQLDEKIDFKGIQSRLETNEELYKLDTHWGRYGNFGEGDGIYYFVKHGTNESHGHIRFCLQYDENGDFIFKQYGISKTKMPYSYETHDINEATSVFAKNIENLKEYHD